MATCDKWLLLLKSTGGGLAHSSGFKMLNNGVWVVEVLGRMVLGKGARAGVECEPQPTHVLPPGKPGDGEHTPEKLR